MKAETINNNIHRLLFFMNVERDRWPTFSSETEYSPVFLFNQYGRMLDYLGAPKEGLSRLFLPVEEYMELEEWIAQFPTEVVYHRLERNEEFEYDGQNTRVIVPPSVGIMYDGYLWHIEKSN